MRDVEVTLTAARFASIAVCAPDLVNVDGMNPLDTLPYQQDRSDVLRLLIARGVRVKDDYKDPPVREMPASEELTAFIQRIETGEEVKIEYRRGR